MYRNWAQLREGWTKNLALLFPRSRDSGVQSFALWWRHGRRLPSPWLAHSASTSSGFCRPLFWLLAYRRIRAAHFATANNWMQLRLRSAPVRLSAARSKQAYAERAAYHGRAVPTMSRTVKATVRSPKRSGVIIRKH
jgi:hypothetical protein